MKPEHVQSESMWRALRHPLFRSMWIAITAVNMGQWMHELASGWLMTTLTDSHLMVALVQTANALPFFLLAIPAGALADIVDRRKLLLVTNIGVFLAAVTVGFVTLSGHISPWLLLGLNLLVATCNAMMRPTFQACVPDFVPEHDLRPAVSLNSTSSHSTRAIGPLLAGLLLAQFGAGPVFLVNAAMVLVLIGMVWMWRPAREEANDLPVERFLEAMGAGLRYVQHTPALHTVLIRGFSFFVFGSVIWALLPVVAVHRLGGGPQTYGLLAMSFGVGAIIGTFVIPRIQGVVSRDTELAAGPLVLAATIMALGFAPGVALVATAMFAGGIAWNMMFSTLSIAAQLAVPNWVRARGLSLVILMFGGSAMVGSLASGRLADAVGIPLTMAINAFGMLAATLVCRRFRLGEDEHIDMTQSMFSPLPQVKGRIELDRGPVLVTVEHRVPADRTADFLALMQEVRRIRKRSGAFFWEVFTDTNDPERHVETFMTDSWLEHLRQHQRWTESDRVVLHRLHEFRVGDSRAAITHFVASHARVTSAIDVE
ncbi:MAG: MFS transporter [Gammaproteobacteria bacterium]